MKKNMHIAAALLCGMVMNLNAQMMTRIMAAIYNPAKEQ